MSQAVETVHDSSRRSGSAVERARAFVERHVAPVALELDGRHDPRESFSWELIEAAHSYGLATLCLDGQYGGEGLDFPTFIRVGVELAKGDLGIAAMIVQTNRLGVMLQTCGTPEQRERYLSGIVADPRCLLAFCQSEPHLGSDSGLPVNSGPHRTRYHTRAVREGDDWVLTGKKIYIDNGATAKYYLVMAQTDDDAPTNRGTTCFVLEGGMPGLNPGQVFDKTGERLAMHAEVNFDGVRLTDAHVIGEVNRAHAVHALFTSTRNVTAASTALGVAEAAYDCALSYARERVQGGRHLIDHGAVRVDLARLRMEIDAASAYVHATAAAAAGSEPIGKAAGIYPKVVAGEAAWSAAQLAVDLHGARGYTRGWQAEKLLRDALSFGHAGTPTRTAMLKAAKALYGDPEPLVL